MLKLLLLATLQSILLAGGNIFLKLALPLIAKPAWSGEFVISVLANWRLGISGVMIAAGTILWMHIIKVYPLSMAYPLLSLSYVFGMLGASIFFHEHVSPSGWFGMALIVAGCYFVTK